MKTTKLKKRRFHSSYTYVDKNNIFQDQAFFGPLYWMLLIYDTERYSLLTNFKNSRDHGITIILDME